MTITYYNDFEGTYKTVPVEEAPEIYRDPTATIADLRAYHKERKARREAYSEALEQSEYE